MAHLVTRRQFRGKQRRLLRDLQVDTDQALRDFARGVNPILNASAAAAAAIVNVAVVTALTATVQVTVR
jgi:hypothetical protein